MDNETLELDALAQLRLEAEHGEPQPDLEKSDRLPIENIETVPEVFQPRTDGEEIADGLFVEDLAGELKRRLEDGLDPLTVFWTGKRWVLVDGHHRLAAYRDCKEWRSKPVPVRPFEGPLEEAVAFSIHENQKLRLQLTRSERSQFAWRFVCLRQPDRKSFQAVTGQSREQYFKMMRRYRELVSDHPDLTATALASMPWLKVRRGDPFAAPSAETDWELITERTAAGWVKKLKRHFGSQLIKQPDAFALALRELNRGLPLALMESNYWKDIRDEHVPGWHEELTNPEF